MIVKTLRDKNTKRFVHMDLEPDMLATSPYRFSVVSIPQLYPMSVDLNSLLISFQKLGVDTLEVVTLEITVI